MAIRIPWDKYEACLLLDYCLKVEEGAISRKDAVSEVSQKLRKRALDKGLEIDDIFRNENGISMQMSSMRNCFLGKKEGLTISNLFREVVDLYKKDPKSFQDVLKNESDMKELDKWQSFLDWLDVEYPLICGDVESTLKMFSLYGKKNWLFDKPISDIENAEDVNQIQNLLRQNNKILRSKKMRNKVSYALSLFEKFLSENDSNSSEINDLNGEQKDEINVAPDNTKSVSALLSTYFKYGIDIKSLIDLLRLRNYAEDEQIVLPEEDEDLKQVILESGMLVGGKVYSLDKNLIFETREMLNNIFQSGVRTVYYQKFYDKNFEWMMDHCIVTIDILKEILNQIHDNWYLGQNFIAFDGRKSEVEAIKNEINRVCKNDHVVKVNVVTNQLEYVPEEKISWIFSYSPEFVRVCEGQYFRMKYFVISEEDYSSIEIFVTNECNKKGYVSITEIPMAKVAEENYELSPTALNTAVFNTVLKDKFLLNGGIITPTESNIDIFNLLKKRFSDQDECTVSDVQEKIKELMGKPNKQLSLKFLYETFVRVSSSVFIADQYFDFDVKQIDLCLDKITGGRFAPIQKISTFALFPACGHNWNHYVVESFCYRFSQRYQLSVLRFNDRKVGFIVAKELHMSYEDMLSESAAVADVELIPEKVGKFFFDNGMMAKRKFSNMERVINKAKLIREGL